MTDAQAKQITDAIKSVSLGITTWGFFIVTALMFNTCASFTK